MHNTKPTMEKWVIIAKTNHGQYRVFSNNETIPVKRNKQAVQNLN